MPCCLLPRTHSSPCTVGCMGAGSGEQAELGWRRDVRSWGTRFQHWVGCLLPPQTAHQALLQDGPPRTGQGWVCPRARRGSVGLGTACWSGCRSCSCPAPGASCLALEPIKPGQRSLDTCRVPVPTCDCRPCPLLTAGPYPPGVFAPRESLQGQCWSHGLPRVQCAWHRKGCS